MEPYLVLGVPRDAPFPVLKASYRRLVRDNHPDVARDKAAATVRMAQINQAWQLVGDPQKRAAFDAQWRLAQIERENQQRQAREKATRARLHPEKAPPERLKPSPRPEIARGQNHRKTTKKPNAATMREMRLMHQVLVASQLFHREKKIKEATALCRQVLLADGRNVAARELMGDMFAHQGHFQYALMMFDQALQIAPEDQMLRRKRDLLERTQSQTEAPRAVKKARPTLLGRLRAKLKK